MNNLTENYGMPSINKVHRILKRLGLTLKMYSSVKEVVKDLRMRLMGRRGFCSASLSVVAMLAESRLLLIKKNPQSEQSNTEWSCPKQD